MVESDNLSVLGPERRADVERCVAESRAVVELAHAIKQVGELPANGSLAGRQLFMDVTHALPAPASWGVIVQFGRRPHR